MEDQKELSKRDKIQIRITCLTEARLSIEADSFKNEDILSRAKRFTNFVLSEGE